MTHKLDNQYILKSTWKVFEVMYVWGLTYYLVK